MPTIVSGDTDFGALLARRGTALPSLVLFRTADPLSPEQQASLLIGKLPLVEDDLQQGAILVLSQGRTRLRPLPIAVRRSSRMFDEPTHVRQDPVRDRVRASMLRQNGYGNAKAPGGRDL